MDYDFVIVGSGFGGSVSALRLTEKGYKVVVIEQGKWVTPADMEEAADDVKKLLWAPGLGLDGFFAQPIYRHLSIIGGVGVGGGSIVYAAVLLEPRDKFYSDPAWSNLGVDWKKELKPHYKTVSKMLGVVDNPSLEIQDDYLKKTAEAMGAISSFGPTPNGIYFGTPEVMKDDPFFSGIGPSRAGCHLCGECIAGCPHGSKNSLDKNYLYLAQRLGATILPQRKVTNIVPQEDGGYLIEMQDPLKRRRKYPPISCRKVIVAAGVLGTLELLFRCRDVTKTLPAISNQMGKIVRTNSEAIVGAISPDPELDLSHGTTISSHFYPDEQTHITQNRLPKGYTYSKGYYGPLVDDPRPLRRALRTLWAILSHPLRSSLSLRAKNWHKRFTTLTVMQHLDNQISFKYGRSLLFLFLGRRLKSKAVKGKEAPTNLAVANKAASIFAKVSGGQPLNLMTESIGNLSTTAHILGGCHMGSSPENGVIDTDHQVFGYPGLYVVDGAAISANVGVNPSLTITAISERAMSRIPSKSETKEEPLQKISIETKKGGSIVKKFLVAIGMLIVLNLGLTGINILQNGLGGWDGRSVEQILGVPAENATVQDIEKLSKSEVMQLFYSAPAPAFGEMNGEYTAKLIPVGILAPAGAFFTHNIFGPGHWEGKGFKPVDPDKKKGEGYNLFAVEADGDKKTIVRTRRMNTYLGVSTIDKRESFNLDYSPYNTGTVHSMRDEIRKINDNLYICMGHMALGGGSINPAPFVIYGKPTKWVGISD